MRLGCIEHVRFLEGIRAWESLQGRSRWFFVISALSASRNVSGISLTCSCTISCFKHFGQREGLTECTLTDVNVNVDFHEDA